MNNKLRVQRIKLACNNYLEVVRITYPSGITKDVLYDNKKKKCLTPQVDYIDTSKNLFLAAIVRTHTFLYYKNNSVDVTADFNLDGELIRSQIFVNGKSGYQCNLERWRYHNFYKTIEMIDNQYKKLVK